MAKLDTDHGPLVDLVGQGRVFVVPDYQRAYSWKAKKQVAELWSDIKRLYVSRVDEGREEPHFIGSVVIGSSTTKALGPVECPVIDGQQRLITLSIIIAAIRDVLITDPEDSAQVTGQYLAHFKRGEIHRSRVRPGQIDRADFDAIINGLSWSGKTSSLVRQAYNYIAEQLRVGFLEGELDELEAAGLLSQGEDSLSDGDTEDEQLEEEQLEDNEEEVSTVAWDWEELLAVVGTQLELVSISDVAPENAYQIFATLNSTGMPLSQVDLVRNGIFMLLPKLGAKTHRELWSPLETIMGKELLQSYLHTWVIRRGHNVPSKEIYRSAIYELSRAGTRESDVRRVLQGLHDGAWSYLCVTRPLRDDRDQFGQFKVPKNVIQGLARLKQWGTVPMEPLLVEIMERFQMGGAAALSGPEVNRILVLLESFVVRRFVSQVPPNDLRSTFARLTQQVRSKTTKAAFTSALVAGLQERLRRWPNDFEFEEALVLRPLYRSPGQKQTFFILKRIAEALEGKECPQIVLGKEADEYSIEHLLPQSFPVAWRSDLLEWGEADPQEAYALLHTLGNLTLTAYNSELSSLQFDNPKLKMDKKRWIGAQLRLELSREVLTNSRWTSDEIEARSRSLASHARMIWPLAD